jgi:tetratricopeptide (TPR) repeat protein
MQLWFCASAQKRIEKERATNPRYQYSLGVFHLNNGQVDQAIKYLRKALTLNPNYDVALDGLGLAYFMKRDFDEAVKYFQKCITINPALTDAHNHLGTVYQEMGLLDKAEQEYLIAIADDSYHSRELPLFNLAKLNLTQNKHQDALSFVNRALTLNKRMVMAYSLKGQILEKLMNFQEAVECYQQALKFIPEDKNTTLALQFNLAQAYFKNNNYVKAKELFESIRPKISEPEIRANIDKYLEIINKNIQKP